MGFRSTICSDHYAGTIPELFKEKYSDRLLFPDHLLIVSKTEWKYYSNEVFEDYQKVLIEIDFWKNNNLNVNIAVLHEDGMISKVEIRKDGIKYFWMNKDDSWDMENVWMQ